MDERDFFLEARAQRPATLQCSFCRHTDQYDLTWLYRKKRTNLNLDRMDERDRIRFQKAASYMVLLDDVVTCASPTCRRRFEVSGVKTMAFVTPEQLEEVSFGRESRGNEGRRDQGRGQQQPRPRQAGGDGQRRNEQGARQGNPGNRDSRRNDNAGNRQWDDRQPTQFGYSQQNSGQRSGGQQRFGKKKSGGVGNTGNRQGGQPSRWDNSQPLRSPRGKRSDPTGPGGGWH
jgi:hypothetical protein